MSEPVFAFPRRLPDVKVPPDEALRLIYRHSGMTLRDYFAGQALAGMLANSSYNQERLREVGVSEASVIDDLVGRLAYRYADSLLKARGTDT